MPLSRVAKRRLATLIKYMQALPAAANKHFEMSTWLRHNPEDGHGHIKPDQSVTSKALMGCGTKACALGWACAVPSFKRAGLSMNINGEVTYDGRGADNFEVAAEFFGLDQYQAQHLFTGHSERTPKSWAKRAARCLRDWSK